MDQKCTKVTAVRQRGTKKGSTKKKSPSHRDPGLLWIVTLRRRGVVGFFGSKICGWVACLLSSATSLGRFGQLIASIFAAISTSSDLTLLARLDDSDLPVIHWHCST